MRDIAWKSDATMRPVLPAQCCRKNLPVAIAREMPAFLWAMAREVAPT